MHKFGQYQLLRVLGTGGMAEVWLAKKQVAGGVTKRVAVKLLARHLADRPQYREMFLKEARLSTTLNHSNIVQVFDAGVEDGECYMAMEWVDGISLSQLIRHIHGNGEILETEVSVYIIRELLRALAYAHEHHNEHGQLQTIVHRDVSPQNIMISRAGEVKLMDFGIARVSSEETSSTFVKGKLIYMPPEQFKNETRAPTTDLFAVGAILHELLDGKRFRGAAVDENALFGMVMRGDIPPLDREPGEVPDAVDDVRQQLLVADRNERTQSARVAIQQLQAWPGYRDASFTLEALVAEVMEPIVAEVEPVVAEQQTAIVDEDTSRPTVVRPRERTPGHDTVALTVAAPAIATPDIAAPKTEPPGSRSRRSLLLTVTLAVLGVGVAIGSLSMIISPSSEDTPTDVKSEELPQAYVEPAAETKTIDDNAVSTITRPQPLSDSVDEQSQTAETQQHPATVAAPPPSPAKPAGRHGTSVKGPEKKATPALVEVKFTANDYFFVYVKINKKTLTVEPHATVDLPPGRYSVELSRDKQSWSDAGVIVVESGTYEVLLRDPPGLTQKKQ